MTEKKGGYARTALRGSALAGLGYGLSQAVQLAVYVVLSNLVSPHDFGLYAAGGAVLGVGMLLAESGMLAALIYREERLEEAANTALLATMAAGLALAVAAVVISPLIGLIFENDRAGTVTAAMAGCFILRSASVVPDALLQRRFSFLRRLAVEPLGVVAFGVVSIVACANDAGVWGLVAGTYASFAVQAMAAWGFVRWRPRPRRASMEMWRELVPYARQIVLSEFVYRVTSQMDVVVVGYYSGVTSAGQYRNGQRFSVQALRAWVSIGAYVIFPVFARISSDIERFRAAFVRSLRWMCATAFPLSLLLLPLGVPAAESFLGPEWHRAGEVMMGLCLFPAGQMLISLFSEGAKAAGRPGLLPRLHGITFVVLLIGLVLGARTDGSLGAAIAVSTVSVLMGVYGMHLMARVLETDVPHLLGEVWRPALSAIASALVLLWLDRGLIHAADHERLTGALLVVAEAVGALAFHAALVSLLAPGLLQEIRRRGEQPSDEDPPDREHPRPAPESL